MWNPTGSGNCGTGFLNMSSSTSYSCQYPLTVSTCSKSTDLFLGATNNTVVICKYGNCNTTHSLTNPVTAATNVSTTCRNMVTSQ